MFPIFIAGLLLMLCCPHHTGCNPLKMDAVRKNNMLSFKNNRSILKFRGGKNDDNISAMNIEDDDIDDDEEDSEGNDKIQQHGSQPFSIFTDMWIKTPPVTQVYVGLSFAITLLSFLLNKNKFPSLLFLDWKQVVTGLQIWRPLTAFLYFGPLGLNYLLTIHFVWTYMAQLEKLNYKKPENFFVLISFGIFALLCGYALLGFSTKFLGHNLSTYLVYIWARTFEGVDVNVMDLFVLRAELLPWFFCLQTFILEGEFPFADILGIVVGHLYYYLTQQKLLVAPQFLRSYFSSEEMLKKYSRFKDEFE